MTDWTETLFLAAREDPDAIRRLNDLALAEPRTYSEKIRMFILSKEYSDEMGCGVLLELLSQSEGRAHVEQWVEDSWANAPAEAKRKICYWVHIPDGMSNELAVRLFRDSSSTVAQRHLLAAGLAATARNRNIEGLVPELVKEIGEYADPERQESLNGFLASVRDSFQ